ncbi:MULTISPECIES: hypothetical protein [unclassified Microcystis]|uniref:hypothetical protein n=1 Tax=unclassified Microcystis TaxID=2643300 RepID=UPI001190FF0A|nr:MULTISPECIES: hypothetical protein [unclassified Microcystis]MCA2926994.1 hypothetical protein [Microcystis sp. M020S1]MCA2935673.1 hypothetical protein [Microcystis sp. M015S1]MCA2621228.1 hypothetical protein [Microcystis sp. M099S2]MCA2648577.1 hypothetical protein [Microcystis sp. M065S2]MCA2680780.1 hypothetical protein [Microcystis sp. M043S2]
MTANTLDSIRKFISGEDTPIVKELYLLALQSVCQEFIQAINTSAYFLAEIQPNLNSPDSIFLAAAKAKLADLLRFDQVIPYRITELAMREAVIGSNPKINLQLSPEGKLIPPGENDIHNAVASQLADDSLIKELLLKGIIKLSLAIG